MKFPRSIRWRFLAWLAFLLVAVLMGFGVTAWEFFRVSQDARPDPELEKRVRALAAAVDRSWPGPRGAGERRLGPPGGPQGMPGGPGGPPREQGTMPPREGGPGGPPPNEPGDPRGGRMEGAGPIRPMWPAEPGGPGGPPPNEPGPPPGGDPQGAAATPAAASDGSTIRVGPRSVAIGRDVLSLFDGSDGWYWGVWSRDRALTRSTDQVPDNLPRPSAGGGYQTRRRDGWREAWIFNGMGECILVGRPDAAETLALRRFTWSLVAVGAGVLALALGGGWWIVWRALRPVDEISAAAGRIAEGDLAERIPLAQTDGELGRLAGVLNATFARLEAAFAQQRRLTADAAHELRTPVAVLLSETQATLARPRTAEEYRETVEECLAVARQMRRLTESLLDLARLDAGPEAVTRSSMDLATVADECATLLRPLAEEKEIDLACDLAPARVRGDAHRLGQVATNLLSNALHYNRRGGMVRVRTGAQNGHAVLEVSDTGPGIAPEDLPHIFERFWRADPARGRDDGRAGLGLAIAKAVAEAHGGSLEAESEPGAGAVFTLRLPAVK